MHNGVKVLVDLAGDGLTNKLNKNHMDIDRIKEIRCA
jgi:hypothetical protein